MNQTMTSLLQRRSVRAYTRQQVSDEYIEQILDAGIHAATARNNQPWFFSVVQKQELIDKMAKAALETMHKSDDALYLSKVNDPDFALFYHSPTVIVISGDDSAPHVVADCANATQNMCVAAHSLGLGSWYNASFRRAFHDPQVAAALLEEIGVPVGYTPKFAISLGYPVGEEILHPAGRKRDVIHYIR